MIGWLWLVVFVTEPVSKIDVAVPKRAAETLKIDILVKQPQQCDRGTADEIIVCADNTDNESQRIRPIANAAVYDKDESAAEFGISENTRMAVTAESEELGSGVNAKG